MMGRDASSKAAAPARASLPIDAILPAIIERLDTQSRLVIEASPGSGKTTRVPPALMTASWCSGRVLMLEPRRLAARAAATFMATELGEQPGGVVGYRMRFESRVSQATRIEVVTEGILTRLLQRDPTLEGVSALVFDEFHERHLTTDLGLALALDVQAALRPDLRIVLMSATFDGAQIAARLEAAYLLAEGQNYPVEIHYQPPTAGREQPLALRVRRAVAAALERTAGDVLCFLPGKAEIRRCAAGLIEADPRLTIEQLHGDLPVAEQARLLKPADAGRRVILATNIAESSITLPGISAVVDSGLAREPRFDPASAMSRLETVMISAPSATQRAGRAGRLGPGVCYRLWAEGQRLERAARPELLKADLAGLVLELRAWGSDAVRFLDPPPPGPLRQAESLLIALGALDGSGRITAHGRAMLALGTAPRLANAVLRAPPESRGLACDLVALLEARDPLMRADDVAADDLYARLESLWRWRRRQATPADTRALADIDRAARHWRRRVEGDATAPTAGAAQALGLLLAHAYPDRIAARDPGDPGRYRLSSGRGARLAPDSALRGTPWLVAADLAADSGDSRVQRALPLAQDDLLATFAARFTEQAEIRFNPQTGTVESERVVRFEAIVLERQRVPTVPGAAVETLLLEGVRSAGLRSLAWSAETVEKRARIAFLRDSCPELALPDCSDAALNESLEEWLAPLLAGRTRLDDVTSQALEHALTTRLGHAGGRALDEHAPTRVRVPSGAERRLRYAEDTPPVLEVKLQEMFGAAEGPTVARGRVAVVLHLLSPRGAPIQVTSDLQSFWAGAYTEVKKELKGRYPRHPWPDDPLTAPATARAKPRRR